MFIAISDVDHEVMLNNCDVERWNGYFYDMENPVFMGMTFERVCESIKRYYQSIDDNGCPDYAIYEINNGSWTVARERTIAIDIERHDA